MTNPLEILPQSYVDAMREHGGTLADPSPIKVIGQYGITQLVKALRRTEQGLTSEIGLLSMKLEKFDGKVPGDFAHEAEEAVDVTVLNAGIYPESSLHLGDGWSSCGHSTFIRCGACRHKSSTGIPGVKCGFLGALDDKQIAPHDSPCLMRTGGVSRISELSQAFKKRIQTLKDNRELVRKHIKKVRELLDDAQPLPLLPVKHFDQKRIELKYGDRVRVFVYTPCCRKADIGKWQPATVLQAGSIFWVCFDHPIMTAHVKRNGVDKGQIIWPKHVWFADMDQYLVLHEWEYQKLRQLYAADSDDAFCQEWLKASEKDEIHTRDRFSGQHVGLNLPSIAMSLLTATEVPPLDYDQRLMGADEAIELLELQEANSSEPSVIVTAYRRLKASGNPGLIRAKDTLLLRANGFHSTGD